MIRKTWNVEDIAELVEASLEPGQRLTTRLALALVPFVDVEVVSPCTLERAKQEQRDWNERVGDRSVQVILSPRPDAPSGAKLYAVVLTRT